MINHRIGVAHPGEMGISVAATALRSGQRLYWASEGRSEQTHARAAKFDLCDAHTIEELCATCSVIVSVCPPHAATSVAQRVLRTGFNGIYLDANAIAPRRAVEMSRAMAGAGIDFVDGGIIGGPAWTPGTTRLYLSGRRAGDVAACFSAGPLEARVIGLDAGRASALKMCYAAFSKGTTALLSAVLAAAERLGVREELCGQWSSDEPGLPAEAERRLRQASAKAWRFVGEMEEIAATFRDAGLPGEFHQAAAVIYGRLTSFKDAHATPALGELLVALLP